MTLTIPQIGRYTYRVRSPRTDRGRFCIRVVRFVLGETLIPNKYKELIGIGIHAETRCRYCTLFHTEAARLFGASDEEIQEAVHYSKMTVGWSAYLNGMQVD